MAPQGSPRRRRRRFPRLLPALGLALALALATALQPAHASDPSHEAAAEPDPRFIEWVAAERPAQQFRRTKLELSKFASQCSWMAEDWQRRVVDRHAALDRVIVFDARHGRWSGIGDSLLMWMSMLRFARAVGRAGFIQLDPCADPQTPPRTWPTQLSKGDECRFDAGAFFRGFGPNVDWQWSEATRRRVEARQGPRNASELVLGCFCMNQYGDKCELRFENGTVALASDFNDSRDGPSTKEEQWRWFRRAASRALALSHFLP